MISITSQEFDPQGYLQISPLPDNEPGALTRRVSRVATLDGGVAINDRGFSHGDRTLTYRYKPVSEEHDARARRLLQLHSRVNVSNEEGVFECVPDQFEPSPDENTLTLIVVRKLTED